MNGPNPSTKYPIKDYDKLIFLKNFIKSKNIIVGDYTYFDDPKNGPENFEKHNVLYNYEFSKTKLIIGKFCAIASETRFILNGNHKMDAFSTYPFPIFKKRWEKAYDIFDLPPNGNIVIGNDVWLGYDSLIKGGISIGDGAIVASRSVVVADVPPYAIVGGNPAKIIKMRFDDKTIDRLLKIAWWNWSIEKITANLEGICGLDIEKLSFDK